MTEIVKVVKVNRSRTVQEALDSTGRDEQFVNRTIASNAPKGEGDEVEIVFFKPDLSKHGGFISDDDLEKKFELHGLKPADPISLAAFNEANPTFADEKPHGTHWKDDKGKWCYLIFHFSNGERWVELAGHYTYWSGEWSFACFRRK